MSLFSLFLDAIVEQLGGELSLAQLTGLFDQLKAENTSCLVLILAY